jgi:hypothetical protein
MIAVKPISSLGVSYFTSTWTLRRITHPLLKLIRKSKIKRKERRSVTNNTTKLITQMNYTINRGELRTTKTKLHRKTTKFLEPTLKTKIHIEKSRQQTTCKTCSASLKTKQEKSFTVVTLRSRNKNLRRQGENSNLRIDILKNTTNSSTSKIWKSRLRPQLVTIW